MPFADIIQNFEDIGAKTGFTWPQFLAQCVAVTILFLLLQKFAWAPVRKMLDDRRKIIADSMTNADQIKKELADAEATRLSIIQKANERANAIIADAEKSAAAVTELRAKEATRQAEDILKNARETTVIERNRMLEELKRPLGELVIQTTEKVVGKTLSPADQARLNDETTRQLNATNN